MRVTPQKPEGLPPFRSWFALSSPHEVLTGPNAGALGTCSASPECLTDAAGQVSFTYTGNLAPGTDVIRACIDYAGGNDNCSPAVVKHWVDECGEDGTPCHGPRAAGRL